VVGGEQDLHRHALEVHRLRLVAQPAAAELPGVQLRELAYMLREIARRGGQAERDGALDTLGVSATLRSARTQAEARRAAIGPPRSPTAALRVPKVDRVIRDAAGSEDLEAPIVRREGDPDSGDPAVDEAFEYFGATWDFFFEVFARDSIDGEGMTLDGVVHYGRRLRQRLLGR
jgi:Thermolysin metallopeptidase, catalytic domain